MGWQSTHSHIKREVTLSHSCTPQHHKTKGSSHPVSPILEWHSDQLGGNARGHFISSCSGQAADDTPGSWLFKQSLKNPTTSPGILSHSIYSSVQECHYFLLYPLQASLSISFFSWHLYEFPHPFRKPEQSQGIAPSQRFFLVAVVLTTKCPGVLFLKNVRLLLSAWFIFYLGASDSHSLTLLLFRADIRSIRASTKSPWQSMTAFLPETTFQEQNFYLFKGVSASHDTQTAARVTSWLSRGNQFPVLWALGGNADLSLLPSSIHTLLGWGWTKQQNHVLVPQERRRHFPRKSNKIYTFASTTEELHKHNWH